MTSRPVSLTTSKDGRDDGNQLRVSNRIKLAQFEKHYKLTCAPRPAVGPVPAGPLREPPLGLACHALPARLIVHTEGREGRGNQLRVCNRIK